MERVRLIYEQIEEAKKLLLAGSLLQLRLALILLDNAVELMMYRELEYQFAWDDSWRPGWQPALDEWLRAGLGPKYTAQERKEAERNFDPKARILGFRLGRISPDEQAIIKVCHKLRCGAFHRGHLRPEILLPVCRLLYLTCAELTVKLRFKAYTASPLSAEDQAFLGRFGITSSYLLGTDEGVNQLRNKLTEGVTVNPMEVSAVLSGDLVSRLDSIVDGLAYVGETEDEAKIDYNLQYTQFWQEEGAELRKRGLLGERVEQAFEEWKLAGRARYTLAKLKKWRRHSLQIASNRRPAAALACFWAIESRFGHLEDDVQEAVARFDERINELVHHQKIFGPTG